MDGWLYWVTEHLLVVLVVGWASFTVLTALAGRALWRYGRRLKEEKPPWATFAGVMLVFLLMVAGLGAFTLAAAQIGPALLQQQRMVGEPAPALHYTRMADDEAFSLADHRGDVVLVNLWATWCPPCRAEMPDLERLQQTYRDRGLVVLQISDEPRETIAEYLEASPMSTFHGYVERFPWPSMGRPTTFIVDRQGILRKSIQGTRTYEQFEVEIASYF